MHPCSSDTDPPTAARTAPPAERAGVAAPTGTGPGPHAPAPRRPESMPTGDADADPTGTEEELPMDMLAAGIPLTLLMDLAETFGPPSQEILTDEDAVDPATDPWWKPPHDAPKN